MQNMSWLTDRTENKVYKSVDAVDDLVELVYLQWKHHQGNTDENDHQQLGRPNLWRDVTVAHSGEGDDAEVEGVKQGQVLPGSL